MDPISIGLGVLSLGGGLLGITGKKKRQSIDPDFLKRTFGAQAVNDELMQLYNRAINSVQGQQLMTSAAQQGQQMMTNVARGSAAEGMGGGEGMSSGSDILRGASAGGYVSGLQRNMQSQLMQAMLPIAQQDVQSQLAAYMQGENMKVWSPYSDTTNSELGSFLQNLGGMGLANMPAGTSGGDESSPSPFTLPNPFVSGGLGMNAGTQPGAPPPAGSVPTTPFGGNATFNSKQPGTQGVTLGSKLAPIMGQMSPANNTMSPAPPMIPPKTAATMTAPRLAQQQPAAGVMFGAPGMRKSRFQTAMGGAVQRMPALQF